MGASGNKILAYLICTLSYENILKAAGKKKKEVPGLEQNCIRTKFYII